MGVAIKFRARANGCRANGVFATLQQSFFDSISSSALPLVGIAMTAIIVSNGASAHASSPPKNLTGFVASAPAVSNKTVTTLTSVELSAFQILLVASLQAAKGNSEGTNEAISHALQNAIAKYGRDAAGPITSAIIAVAEQVGVPHALIGSGLALSSVAELKNNPSVSSAIALALANEGKPEEIASFQFTVAELENVHLGSYDKKWADEKPTPPPDLVSIAGSEPAPTASIQNGPSPLGTAFTGGFPGGGPTGNPCLTPSCTHL